MLQRIFLHLMTWNFSDRGFFICVYSGYGNVVIVSVLPATYSYIIIEELKLQKEMDVAS